MKENGVGRCYYRLYGPSTLTVCLLILYQHVKICFKQYQISKILWNIELMFWNLLVYSHDSVTFCVYYVKIFCILKKFIIHFIKRQVCGKKHFRKLANKIWLTVIYHFLCLKLKLHFCSVEMKCSIFFSSDNETEISFFRMEDYLEYKKNPHLAWWSQYPHHYQYKLVSCQIKCSQESLYN